ncbi:MAG: AarF/UbiB family protein, partial [Pseudomonadota bacterium]
MIPAAFRLWRIHTVIRRYRLQEFWNGKPSNDPRPRGERLRLALEELGTVFIKFGQALSTRPDVLPPDVALELQKLQDQVPPFPTEQAKALIEAALGKPLAELFARFDDAPLASASVAQVHTAKLHGEPGLEVIVKVLRPGIEVSIEKDIGLLHTIASLIERLHPEGHRIQPVAIVAEYAKSLRDELDLMREAANCGQLRRNW